VRERLHLACFSTRQYKALPKVEKRYIAQNIENAFVDMEAGFFQYTRRADWMQDAVGETDGWIRIDGMAGWHVGWALFALENGSDTSNTPPYPPPASFWQEPLATNQTYHWQSQSSDRTSGQSAPGPSTSAPVPTGSTRPAPFDPVRDSVLDCNK